MPRTKICKQCKREFVDKHRDGKIFCNRKCYGDWKRGRPQLTSGRFGTSNSNWRGGNVRVCLNCSKSFVDKHYDGKKYCDRKCYGEHKRELSQVEIVCFTCGKMFSVMRHDQYRRKYCSSKCMGGDEQKSRLTQKKRKGWKMSQEARQKISIANSKRKAQYSYTRGKSGHYHSSKAGNVFYRSSYELKAFQILDSDTTVVNYNVEPFVIVYKNRFGNTKRYRPDILIDYANHTILVEVKPIWRLIYLDVLEKLVAGVHYAKKNRWEFEVWTEYTLGIKRLTA